MDSFGYVLRRFARAVDIVDDDVIHETGTLVQDYVNRELAIEHVDIMRQQQVGNEPGLGTLWSSDPAALVAWPLHDSSGKHTCQVALAYDTGSPLWVVVAGGETIDEQKKCTDLWSDTSDLPPYHAPMEDLNAKTSIVLPLQVGSRKVGALCLDSSSYMEITPVAREELKLVAEAIGILHSKYESTKSSRTSKKNAIGELKQDLADASFRQLAMPHVFVASSGEADPDVVEAITAVLGRDEFSDAITWKHWEGSKQPGPIPQQIIEDITKAKFGICYLSEPNGHHGGDDADDEHHDGSAESPAYRDNLNVLFEAGMLHSLRGIGYSDGWIPVREEDAPPAPFDVATERHVLVPRNEDGSLDRAKFEEQLSGYVRQLTGEE